MIESGTTVSVVLPVRNGARFLSQALDSVLGQTRQPDEIIIVDGNSTDDTPAIIAAYAERDARIRKIVQTQPSIGDAYNIGIKAAEGDYVAFISHDDTWTPDKLAVQLAYMDAHPEVDYSAGRARFFLEPGCSLPSGFRTRLLEGTHLVTSMEVIMMRRALFERVGGFPTDYRSAEDVAWQARASHMGAKLGQIDHLLVHRRVHDKNTSYYNPENTREIFRALRSALHSNKGVT